MAVQWSIFRQIVTFEMVRYPDVSFGRDTDIVDHFHWKVMLPGAVLEVNSFTSRFVGATCTVQGQSHRSHSPTI